MHVGKQGPPIYCGDDDDDDDDDDNGGDGSSSNDYDTDDYDNDNDTFLHSSIGLARLSKQHNKPLHGTNLSSGGELSIYDDNGDVDDDDDNGKNIY